MVIRSWFWGRRKHNIWLCILVVAFSTIGVCFKDVIFVLIAAAIVLLVVVYNVLVSKTKIKEGAVMVIRSWFWGRRKHNIWLCILVVGFSVIGVSFFNFQLLLTAAAIVVAVVAYNIVVSMTKTQEGELDIGMPIIKFTYVDLQVATEDFKEELGRGGFGSVFKGVLPDGTGIAVKRLGNTGQGMKEFLAEVETIGSVHHFNLVRLIGFCAENSSRLLVYEYLVNGSLNNWIFKRSEQSNVRELDWKTRKKVILDIAKGLAYLHEDCRQKIIHLDIKPHNILLDENFNAKVSDFGLAKLIARDESQVLTGMKGTLGYLAPELQQSIVTVKVDVYSFGIVLLDIVTRRRNLIQTLQKKAEEDQLIDFVEDLDEDMENHKEEVVRMIQIGIWCSQNDYTRRPLMSTVVKALQGDMEVDPNIIFNFVNPMAAAANDHIISVAPQESILSGGR